MVHYRRSRVSGGTFFFTANLDDRQQTSLVEHVELLRRALREIKRVHPFTIDAMVVLPSHFHAIWTLPVGDDDYARRLQLFKARFTKRIVNAGVAVAKDRRGEFHLWQKRFWEHTIQDERDFEVHMNYVHFNPVKHGFSTRAVDWPYSTIHRYVRCGWMSVDWGCALEEGAFGE